MTTTEEQVPWADLTSEKKKIDHILGGLWEWSRKHAEWNYFKDDDLQDDFVQTLPLSLSSNASTPNDGLYFAPLSKEDFAAWAIARPTYTWSDHQPQIKHRGNQFYNQSSMISALFALALHIGDKSQGNPGLIHLTDWIDKSRKDAPYVAGSGYWPKNREWRTGQRFETADSRPHMIFTMVHDCRGDDRLVRSELITILETIMGRMRLKRLQQNRVFPVLILSILAPQKARIVHAHWDLTKLQLVIRRSPCYNFEHPHEAQENLDLFLRWVMSTPVGDTVEADTPYYRKQTAVVKSRETTMPKQDGMENQAELSRSSSGPLKAITESSNKQATVPGKEDAPATNVAIYCDANT